MITICIPTKNRPDFLARLLQYYANTGFRHRLFIGDSSDTLHAHQNQQTVRRLQRELSIEYFECGKLSWGGALEELSHSITTQYATVICDDDFLCTAGIDRCIDYLERNPAIGAAQGRGIMARLDRDGPLGVINLLAPYPHAVLTMASAADRLTDLLNAPRSITTAVHRRENWIDVFRGFAAMKGGRQGFIFDDLLSSCLLAERCLVGEVDSLYLVRQLNPHNGRQPDAYDWITDPDWFAAYSFFQARLTEELSRQDGLSAAEAHDAIKQALWPFLVRSMATSWRKHQAPVGGAEPSRSRRVGRRVPGLRKAWRTLRAMSLNEQPISLESLLKPSSPYHHDFMPVYRAVTSDLSVRHHAQASTA